MSFFYKFFLSQTTSDRDLPWSVKLMSKRAYSNWQQYDSVDKTWWHAFIFWVVRLNPAAINSLQTERQKLVQLLRKTQECGCSVLVMVQ